MQRIILFQGFSGDSNNTQVLKKDADGFCQLSQAALCLFEEVKWFSVCKCKIMGKSWLARSPSWQICNLASYCLCSSSTDKACPGTDGDAVTVYVWGSNSSHQLAEGTLEKILLPKLTQGFNDAQTVRLPIRKQSICSIIYFWLIPTIWMYLKIKINLNLIKLRFMSAYTWVILYDTFVFHFVLLDRGRAVLYLFSIYRWFCKSLWKRKLWPPWPGWLQ